MKYSLIVLIVFNLIYSLLKLSRRHEAAEIYGERWGKSNWQKHYGSGCL